MDVSKRFRVRVENNIDEPSLTHWHGRTCGTSNSWECTWSGAFSCQASRPAPSRLRIALDPCCPPAGAWVQRRIVVGVPPTSPPCGSGWYGREWRDRDQAAG